MTLESGVERSLSPPLDPPQLAREWPYPTSVFLILLGLYAYTAPRTVTFEDDGSFIMVAEFLGIAHPPGYPLYALLAKLSTFLPLGSIAYRVHLFSAVTGAATCGLLWWIARTLVADAAIAWVAALAYGLSRVMWSQSIIAEVYTLNTLLFFLLFALSLRLLHDGRSRWIPILGLVYGLALSNHNPLVLLATPCLALILLPRWRTILHHLPGALLGIALGLTPYLWMVLRSWTLPEVSFYGPILNLDEFLYYVTREGYAHLSNRVTAGSTDRWLYLTFLARESLHQLTLLGGVVAGCGFAHQLRRVRTSWSLGMLAGFASGGLGPLLLMNVDYQYLERSMISVYPLIPYGILAIWLALGLQWLANAAKALIGSHARTAVLTLAGGIVAVLAISNYSYNDRRSYDFAQVYGTALLESLPPDAILFTSKDTDLFPLGYLHRVEGIRPDVDLYHHEGLVFANRLFRFTDGDRAEKDRKLREFVLNSKRPIFFVAPRPLGFGVVSYGFYSLLDPALPASHFDHRIRPELLELARDFNARSGIEDPWTLVNRDSLVSNFMPLLVRELHENPNSPMAAQYHEDVESFSAEFHGAFLGLLALHQIGSTEAAELYEQSLRCEELINERVTKQLRSRLATLQGRLLEDLGRDEEAATAYDRAIALYPDRSNPAILSLLRVFARTGQRELYSRLRDQLVSPENREEIMKLDRQIAR